jgi:retron-type reverse transcriptase
VVDLDIKGFFDNIDHAKMLRMLRKYTTKKHILLYCERWLKAPVLRMNGELDTERRKGTPQGGVISYFGQITSTALAIRSEVE